MHEITFSTTDKPKTLNQVLNQCAWNLPPRVLILLLDEMVTWNPLSPPIYQ